MEKGVSANRVIVSVLTVLVLVPLAFLTVNSVLMTADIPEPSTEATVFGPDMPWVHLAAAAAVAVLLAVFRGQLARLPEKRLLTVGMTLVFVAGLVWVFTMRVEKMCIRDRSQVVRKYQKKYRTASILYD